MVMLSKSYYKLYYLPKTIDKELLRNIILTVGVFKSQIKLVLGVEHVKTGPCSSPRTLETTTSTVNVHSNILGKLLGILQPSISARIIFLFLVSSPTCLSYRAPQFETNQATWPVLLAA